MDPLMTVLAGFFILMTTQFFYRLSMSSFSAQKRVFIVSVRRPYRLFFSILLNLSSYGYYKTTLSTKIFFLVLGAFSVLKLKVAKIPIQNGPFLAP